MRPPVAVRRRCACGGTPGPDGECAACRQKRLQRTATSSGAPPAPSIVHDVLRSRGRPLDASTQTFMEARFGHDFSRVRVHTDDRASESARAVDALAYTVGSHVVFGKAQYDPASRGGRQLLAHELAHVVQQGSESLPPGSGLVVEPATTSAEREAASAASSAVAGAAVRPASAIRPTVQRVADPFIKKVTVHLAPPQSAVLEWEGTPPASAPGSDSFTVSTGKGYSDVGDPPGTCTRTCCTDPDTQCAPPWNQPDRVGACCTYFGSGFWTGTPQDEHNGWKYWTPIQPNYSTRGIALHQHTEVTGQPIGHGCVRMDEDNAHRIYSYSRGRRTAVAIDGRAAPVLCDASRRCGAGASLDQAAGDTALAQAEVEPVAGLEGEMT